jgi:hypothetical protein
MTLIISSLISMVCYVLNLYLLILLATFVIQTLQLSESSPVIHFLLALTDTPCLWLKKKFPFLLIYRGGYSFDLSAFALMIFIGGIVAFLNNLQTKL